jgi:hypothetical protein
MVDHSCKNPYDTLIRESIHNKLVELFAFGNINFSWIYSVSPITIIDSLTHQYMDCNNDPEELDVMRVSTRYYYKTPYIDTIIYNIAEYYEFLYTDCMKCDERAPCQYCDMDPGTIRGCIQRKWDRFYSTALRDE